jgi:hypothetical protein
MRRMGGSGGRSDPATPAAREPSLPACPSALAEREGFEPPGLAPCCFQDSRLKPLGHRSAREHSPPRRRPLPDARMTRLGLGTGRTGAGGERSAGRRPGVLAGMRRGARHLSGEVSPQQHRGMNGLDGRPAGSRLAPVGDRSDRRQLLITTVLAILSWNPWWRGSIRIQMNPRYSTKPLITYPTRRRIAVPKPTGPPSRSRTTRMCSIL